MAKTSRALHCLYNSTKGNFQNKYCLVFHAFRSQLIPTFDAFLQSTSTRDGQVTWSFRTINLFQEKSRTAGASHFAEKIYEILESVNVDTIIDDRIDLTIGRRIIDARRTGYPYLVIIGKKAIESTPFFEIHDQNNSNQIDLSLEQFKDFFENTDVIHEREREASIA